MFSRGLLLWVRITVLISPPATALIRLEFLSWQMLALEEWFCRGLCRQSYISPPINLKWRACQSRAECDPWEDVGEILLESDELCQSRSSAREQRMILSWSGRGTVCWVEGGGFIFHSVTDRFTFISINPIIEVDLFSPAMQFQLTNPASPSFLKSVTVRQGHFINFWLVLQRKRILCDHGDGQPWLISTTSAGGTKASRLSGLLCVLGKIWLKR